MFVVYSAYCGSASSLIIGIHAAFIRGFYKIYEGNQRDSDFNTCSAEVPTMATNLSELDKKDIGKESDYLLRNNHNDPSNAGVKKITVPVKSNPQYELVLTGDDPGLNPLSDDTPGSHHRTWYCEFGWEWCQIVFIVSTCTLFFVIIVYRIHLNARSLHK